MGIVAFDKDFHRTIEMRLRQMGKRAAKHGVEFMRESADQIVEQAKDFAPRDEGDLEKAIERNPEEQKDERRRKTVGIWVNPNMPGSGGMNVGDYAYLMHEGLHKYGDGTYGLGGPQPGTAAKIESGLDSGGKFFERAINKFLPTLTAKITDLLRRQNLL